MTLVPLTSGAYQSESVIANVQRCVNLYPEVNPKATTPPVPVTHYQRPGKVRIGGPVVPEPPPPEEALFFVVGQAPLEAFNPIITRSASLDASVWENLPTGFPDGGVVTSIAEGADTLVAGGQDDVSELGIIVRSEDGGDSWASIANGFSPLSAKVLAIAFGNAKFLAGGFTNNGALLQTSDDLGLTWFTQSTFTGGFSHISAAFFDGSQYLIGGQATGFASAISTSPDAIAWTPRTTGFAGGDIQDFATNGSRLVAVGGTGSIAKILTSDDAGVTWITRTHSFGPTSTAYSVAHGNGTFVVVGQGDPGGNSAHVETSLDGETWAPQATPFPGGSIAQSVRFGNGIFILTGIDNTSHAVIFTSVDGVVWASQTTAFPVGQGYGRGALAV